MKIVHLSVVLMAAFAGLACQASSQSSEAPKPDLPLAESKKISPFPPKNVEVQFVEGSALLKWAKVPSEKITGYDIYRMVDDGKLEKVGHTKELEFIDKTPPKGKVVYAVASVDYNENRSKPRLATVSDSR